MYWLCSEPSEIYEWLTSERAPKTLYTYIIAVYYIVLMIVAFHAVLIVRLNWKGLEPMLRVGDRAFGDIAVPLAQAAIQVAWPLYHIRQLSAAQLCRMLSTVLLKLVSVASFLIYTDLATGVMKDQEEI